MSRKESCKSPDLLRKVVDYMTDCVHYFWLRGHVRNVAIEQAADALGLTPRKAFSLYYEQPVANIRPSEYDRITRAFLEHLEQRAEDLARRAEAARTRRRQIEAEWQQQNVADLGMVLPVSMGSLDPLGQPLGTLDGDGAAPGADGVEA